MKRRAAPSAPRQGGVDLAEKRQELNVELFWLDATGSLCGAGCGRELARPVGQLDVCAVNTILWRRRSKRDEPREPDQST